MIHVIWKCVDWRNNPQKHWKCTPYADKLDKRGFHKDDCKLIKDPVMTVHTGCSFVLEWSEK